MNHEEWAADADRACQMLSEIAEQNRARITLEIMARYGEWQGINNPPKNEQKGYFVYGYCDGEMAVWWARYDGRHDEWATVGLNFVEPVTHWMHVPESLQVLADGVAA